MPIPLSSPITITGLPVGTPTANAILPFDNAGTTQTQKSTVLGVLNATSYLSLSSDKAVIGNGTDMLQISGGAVTLNGSPLAGLAGVVDPEGVITASPGTSYLKTDTNGLYFKVTGTDANGWQQFIQL